MDFRFTLNIASIARVVAIDANQDNKITYPEIEAAAPLITQFLKAGTLVSINDDETDVGEARGWACFWPNPTTSEITPADAGGHFVDFNFQRSWPKGVVDVWLGFQVFERLGELHTIQCVFQQEGEHDTPVEFSIQEPDYLFDTGWEPGAVPAPAATPAPKKPWRLAWRASAAAAMALTLGIWLWRRSKT